MPVVLRSGRPWRAGVAALVAVSLTAAAGLAPAAAAPASAGTPVAGKGRSPLSARLDALAQAPVRSASAGVQAAAAELPAGGPGSLLRHGSRLLVDLAATSPSVIATAAGLPGNQLVATAPDGLTATVAVPASGLAVLAGVAGLRSAREVLAPKHNGVAAPARATSTSVLSSACPSGVVSGGDQQLRAALARSTYSVDGAGVKVGVISDSFGADAAALTADIASGDLPGAGNPCGFNHGVQVLSDYLQADASDEGRAMVQIVHDLAPGADLLFASGYNGEIDFANQIRALRDAGADVIVDDLSYYDEPIYQDGPVAVAVNEVVADGVAYYSAAGNAEVKVAGKPVGSYEAQGYRPTTCAAPVPASQYTCHDFDPGAAFVPYDTLTIPANGTVILSLGWNQPAYGLTTDLDVFLIDASNGDVVASGNDDSFVSGQAVEVTGYTNDTGSTRPLRLVVARYKPSGVSATGTPRLKVTFQKADVSAVQFSTAAGGDVFGPTLFGHSGTTGAGSIAATRVTNDTNVESFSSRGPNTLCWNPIAGTTPATALPACTVKQIDVTATDGVGTTLPGGSGLNPFYGTSAAAPHAAAVAALFLQRQPCATPAQIMTQLKANASVIVGYGPEAEGSGLVDAFDTLTDATTCVGAPSAPGAPLVTAAGAHAATFAWAPPTTLGGGTLTGYTVQVLDPAGTVLSTTPEGTATSATITGLAAGAYRFRVRAEAGASGPYSPRSGVAVPPFRTVSAFTDRQLLDFAGRHATAVERRDWNALVVDGTSSPGARVARATLFSAWGPKLDPITRMSYAALAKTPDTSTLGYWLPRQRAGGSITAMASSYVTSAKFASAWGTLTNRQFVQRIYLNVQGHPATAASENAYTSSLDTKKKTRGQVLAELSETAVHKGHRAGEVGTVSVFYGMLRRGPTTAEVNTWKAQTATTKVPLANALLTTASYDART